MDVYVFWVFYDEICSFKDLFGCVRSQIAVLPPVCCCSGSFTTLLQDFFPTRFYSVLLNVNVF